LLRRNKVHRPELHSGCKGKTKLYLTLKYTNYVAQKTAH